MKIAIIGTGKLGSSLARGFIGSKKLAAEDLVLVGRRKEAVLPVAKELSVENALVSASDVPDDVDCCFVAVKPDDLKQCLTDLSKAYRNPNRMILSTAAGVTLEQVSYWLGKKGASSYGRIMPNIATMVQKGVIGMYFPDSEPERLEEVTSLLNAVGQVVQLKSEAQLDAVTALGGSAPAFVSLMVDSLIDGGVLIGLSREQSESIARSVIRGVSGILDSGVMDETKLKAYISSPAGTTVRGLKVLEESGLKGSVLEAVESSFLRAKDISEKIKKNSH